MKQAAASRTCKCGNTYVRFTTLQNKCIKCLIAKGRQIVKKETRKVYREQKEKLKTRRDYEKEAQIACNAFIRERDRYLPCISCGRHHQGQWHAGHFRPTSSYPMLRFNEHNIHKQCSVCNNYRSGNLVEYRKNLIQKIGKEKVEWLEGPHEPKKYTIDDLKQIRAKYRGMVKALLNKSRTESV